MKEIKFSIRLAVGLLAIGTLLLVTFAVNLSTLVLIIGYLYSGLAMIVCMGYIIAVFMRLMRRKLDFSTGLKAIGISLINLPVAVVYFYLVITLLNTARITFDNATGHNLSTIKIIGCDNRTIGSLGIGKSKTIWIQIPHDCSIEITYDQEGETKREIVAEYLSNSGEVIATYRIGASTPLSPQ